MLQYCHYLILMYKFCKLFQSGIQKSFEKVRENKQNASESEIVDAAFDMHIANLAKG